MVETKQTANNQSENVNRTTTEQSCVGTTRADMGTGVSSTEQAKRTTTGEFRSSAAKNGSQAETQREKGSMNPALSRALIGGLIGGTLGSLAGALAGRRIGEGFNHTMRGVKDASKTIAEGLGHTARGVGDVAKSFAEGASHAVVGDVGDALDTAQGVAEEVKQTAVSTLNAVQQTAQDVNQATEKTKSAAENTRPWQNGGNQDSQQTQNQDIGMGQRETSTHSIYISTPEYTEGYVGESTTFVNEKISIEPFEDSSIEQEINRIDS